MNSIDRQLGRVPGPTLPGATGTDWSPEQQLALMLDLFAAQMDAALREADQSVDDLSRAFDALLASSRGASTAAALDSTTTDDSATTQAVVAMQFYDRLSQRLEHVRYSMSTLAMFMCDAQNSRQRERWQRLQSSLRRLYSSEDERALFEMMIQGTGAEEALQRTADRGRKAPKNNIEFF